MAAQDEALPGYTPASAVGLKTDHKYSLESKGRSWLSIHVKSRSPSPASLPYFVEGDVIAGHVELDLDKPESMKSIAVVVLGGTTTVGQEEQLFLSLDQALWPAAGDKSGKVTKGSWPFSFTLPAKVSTPEVKGTTFAIPPSFSERASPAYIEYRIVVQVRRGAFKSNQTLSTSFAFLPLTTPDAPSKLRQLAYKDGVDLKGPEEDPTGWKVLAPVRFKGKLFDAREVEAEATLAIATPLAFTAGTPIPLFLTLQSKDEQALDTLAATQAVRVYLVRSLAIGSDAVQEGIDRRSNTNFLAGVGQAYFWLSEGGKEQGKRVMRGELDVKKSVKPSCVFPRFTIRYTVELLNFSATGFAPTGSETKKALISEPVRITTRSIPGIVPKSYAPPGYEKPPETDYNSAFGFLENGNQRFMHHHGSGMP